DVSILGTPPNAKVGDTITQTIVIHNFGPCDADTLCASNANATALNFVSNTGDCTRPYGACNLAGAVTRPRFVAANECGFANAHPPGDPMTTGFLPVGGEFRITSTYVVTGDALPGSVTNTGVPNEVDIQANTNLINYGTHTQAAMTQTLIT